MLEQKKFNKFNKFNNIESGISERERVERVRG